MSCCFLLWKHTSDRTYPWNQFHFCSRKYSLKEQEAPAKAPSEKAVVEEDSGRRTIPDWKRIFGPKESVIWKNEMMFVYCMSDKTLSMVRISLNIKLMNYYLSHIIVFPRAVSKFRFLFWEGKIQIPMVAEVLVV